ncbi:hypothetical protein K438DRAFT_1762302 [Mycena galopus ATCC 62051]|nr:hypothetical protein K438DRAFT_1762302 [Mycena galopus ATCC 62051]
MYETESEDTRWTKDIGAERTAGTSIYKVKERYGSVKGNQKIMGCSRGARKSRGAGYFENNGQRVPFWFLEVVDALSGAAKIVSVKEKAADIKHNVPGEHEVHDRAIGGAGVDEGGTVRGGEAHNHDFSNQADGVLVGSDAFSPLEENAEVGSFVAVLELHVKVVKVRVDLCVEVEALDHGPAERVAAAGGEGNFEGDKTGAWPEGGIVAGA